MVTVRQSGESSNWLRRLKDDNAVVRIVGRVRRLESGNPGDVRSVGGGVMEMRIDYGPGYPVYYVQRREQLVILLCDGDKRAQQQDIRRAQEMAKEL